MSAKNNKKDNDKNNDKDNGERFVRKLQHFRKIRKKEESKVDKEKGKQEQDESKK